MVAPSWRDDIQCTSLLRVIAITGAPPRPRCTSVRRRENQRGHLETGSYGANSPGFLNVNRVVVPLLRLRMNRRALM
jgi:hypothetical protein